jgi:hypothetical protein
MKTLSNEFEESVGTAVRPIVWCLLRKIKTNGDGLAHVEMELMREGQIPDNAVFTNWSDTKPPLKIYESKEYRLGGANGSH